jgi:N-acetylglucosamine kinase-like BadF-type ATPase
VNYYLIADGGGTKLQAILYDENLNIVRTARTAGTNVSFKSAEQVKAEMAELAAALIPEEIREIEAADLCIVGDPQMLLDALQPYCTIKETKLHGEGETALAAAGVSFGVVAQAGTGSDAFLIQEGLREVVGGWGAMLGDEGGGYDIGIRTLKAAIYAHDGRGPKTAILDLLMKEWALERPWDMVLKLIRDPDYRGLVASATHVTATAAQQGDEVALRIYEYAGHELAHQVLTVLNRVGGQWVGPIVASGGAWKGCSRMFETLREQVLARYPDATVTYPIFEPVVGLAVLRQFALGRRFEEFADSLTDHFSAFRYRHP